MTVYDISASGVFNECWASGMKVMNYYFANRKDTIFVITILKQD